MKTTHPLNDGKASDLVETGRWRIEGVKAGKYTLLFRHADTGLNEKREVRVEVGKVSRIVVEWTKVPDDSPRQVGQDGKQGTQPQ